MLPDNNRLHGLDHLRAFAITGVFIFHYQMNIFGHPDWLHEVAPGVRHVFVGFNAPFDWMFVADYFHRFLGRNPFGISALDLKALYMGRDGVALWTDTRFDVIVERYPVLRKGNHNALDDAQAQAELAQKLLGLEPAEGIEPVEGLGPESA